MTAYNRAYTAHFVRPFFKGCGQKADRNHTNILFRAGAVKECPLACLSADTAVGQDDIILPKKEKDRLIGGFH